MHHSIENCTTGDHTDDDVAQIPNTCILPKSLVKTKWNKREAPDQNQPGKHLPHQACDIIRHYSIKSQPERKIVAEHKQTPVKAHDQDSAVLDQEGIENAQFFHRRLLTQYP